MLVSGGEMPDARAFARLWAALREALRAELRRRGLWGSPPSYLGVYGWQRWEEVVDREAEPVAAGAGTPAGGDDALEDLAAGCYAFIFVERLRSLAAQLRVKPDVEGLVLLDVRHFLHQLQKEHDPLGYRVFTIARDAVRRALARGELVVAAGDPRLRNATLLAFGGANRADADRAAAIRLLVKRWNDELLPELVTAGGRRREEVAERLSRCLADLRRQGIASFQFQDLVDPLKRDVRSRWAALLGQAGPGSGALAEPSETGHGAGVPDSAGRPDLELAERAGFAALARCMAASLVRLDTDARTRAYLTTLWNFLRSRAAGAGESDAALRRASPAAAAWDDGGDRGLSYRRLEQLLGIPRQRLPELHQTLGLLIAGCRAGAGAAAPPRRSADPAAAPGTDQPAALVTDRPEARSS
jgi:hypothetical protein